MYEFPDTAPRQRVFILRIWETRSDLPDASATWHFSALDAQNGERRGFSSLEGLMDFLAGQTGQQPARRGGLSLLHLLEAASPENYVTGAAGAVGAAGKSSDASDDRSGEPRP